MIPRKSENPLLDLATRIGRLTVNRHDPEQFFIERSEIAAELRRIAWQQSSDPVRKYSHTFTQMTRPDVR